MRYIYDHDLHIHSQLSLCSSDPEQNNERILQYAKDNGLKTICLTDHYWDEAIPLLDPGFYGTQNFAHISKAKPLPQAEGIRFLFGCETDMDRFMTIGLPKGRFDDFDFIVIPITHFHFKGFTIPAETVTPQDKAAFWLKKLHALLDQELPFRKVGIAHLTCGLIDSVRENYLEMLNCLDTDDLVRVFQKAAQRGAGIELNYCDMNFNPGEAETVLRPYRIAKQVGCKFYMGSDAHHPDDLDAAKAVFERTIDLLELTEEDKFHISAE